MASVAVVILITVIMYAWFTKVATEVENRVLKKWNDADESVHGKLKQHKSPDCFSFSDKKPSFLTTRLIVHRLCTGTWV